VSEVSEIKVEWTPQNSGRVSSIQIQSRIRGQYAGAEEGWTEQAAAHDPTAGSFTFGSNAPGTDVEVRARYHMTSGVYGAWFQDGIKTARVTIPYVDLTGTPSRLSDINPGEGGKLGGIAPGADVTRDNIAKDTSNVGGTPAATVRDNAGNAIAAIRDASGQPIKSADLIAKADADRAAAAAAVEKAKSELTASVAATNTTVATVRQEAAQIRSDLVPQITAARDASAKASTDLSDEIARAKGAEGTIWTTVTAAQKRADDAFTAISTETTQRADGDRLLSQRLDTVESTATTDRSNLTSRITQEVATLVSRDDAIGRRVDSVVAQATTDRTDYNAKINSEATARASVDQALSNKVDVVEARLRGDQDSGLSARIRDEATASVTRDAAITSRTNSLESRAAYTADQVAKTFPGFETTSTIWGWQTELGGRNTGNVGWEPNHEKGAGVAFAPGMGSWLYMDPTGWIKTTPGKRYRAGFWVWQWSAPNGFGGHARVYWEGTNKDYSANTYLGATATSPEATDSFYTPIPNGAWHCYASDIQVDDAIVKNTNCYWIRPRINIDMIPQNGGYVIAGWFFREVTGEWSNAAKITDEATTRAGQDAAIGNRLQIVEANYVTNAQADAKVSAEATARSNETSGLANRIGSVETRYSGAGNLVTNSDLTSLDGWQITSQPAGTSFDRNGGGDYWNITGENSITIGENGVASTLCEIVSAPVAVKGGDYVQGYAFAASHRANNWVSIFFYKRDGSWNGYAGEFTSARYNNGGPDLGGWDQTGAKSVRVPDGTATMRLAIRKYQTFSSEAGSIAWFIRPYLGFARQGQTEWNPYTPGSAKAVVNATNARITDEATASVNRDGAISNRVATTESQISGGQDSWLAARIRDEATASNNRDNSISNRVATTEAQFRGDHDSGLKTLVRNNRRNLVDVGWWKKGAAIPWGLNGGQRNEIVEFPHGGNFDNLPMPDGSSGDAWLCQADGSGQGAGGWNSGNIAPLDPDKTYRFMIPIATFGSGTRTSYWGTSNVCDINTTNENGNPYFAYIGNLTPNKWHLFVGYLFPRNSAGKTHAGAGVWDMATGIKIADGWNYCFRPDGFQPSHRAYQFYATNGAYQAFGRPIIELVDGSEAPVFAALAASKSATNAQARISDEATASANRDNSLSNRISTTESQMSGGQDSWLAARIRDEATASANRDSSLSNRVTTTEANYTGVRNDLNNWNGDRYQDYLRVNGRVTDEATASANRDNALSNRVSTTEAQIAGGQDSWLAARIRDEATASANRDASISNRTSVVEAQVSNDSGNMLRNGTFNAPGWVGRGGAAIPPGWGGWANDNGAFLGASPRDSRYGAPAPLQIDRGGINNGITQPIYNVAPGWYAFEVDVTGEDGNWSGSGVHVNFNNGYVFNFGFATNADTAGRFGDIGTANRQFTWLFYNGANTANANLYLMSGWSGFQGGTNFGFFRSVWHRVVMRPATAGEIAAQKVQDSNLVARVSTTESAISTLNGRAAAYWQVQAVAGNNRAQMSVRADANGGGGVDIVGDVNFAGNLNVGADSGGNRMKITNQNIQVFDGNGTRRVAFGLNF